MCMAGTDIRSELILLGDAIKVPKIWARIDQTAANRMIYAISLSIGAPTIPSSPAGFSLIILCLPLAQAVIISLAFLPL